MTRPSSPDSKGNREAVEVLAEREACAQLLELTNAELRHAAGEISAAEMRIVQSVLGWLARRIRSRPIRRDRRYSAAEVTAEELSELQGLRQHDVVTQGVPVNVALEAIQRFSVINLDEVLNVLGVSEKSLKLRANTVLDANASDRAWRLLSVVEQATKVMGIRDTAECWLAAPAIGLDGRRPIDLLTSSEGTAMVRTLLARMEYGVFS